MRFAHRLAFGILAVALGASEVGAQSSDSKQGRNFGSANCKPEFSCDDLDAQKISTLAASCASSGLGALADFTDQILDNNNCMKTLIGDTGKASSSAVCCVVPVQSASSMCIMSCSLVMYQ